MSAQPYTVRTVADDPSLRHVMADIIARSWPACILESRTSFRDMLYDWDAIYDRWPQYQFCLFPEGSDTPIACGNSLALAWDGDHATLPARGWTWAIHNAERDHDEGRPARTQCALGISILPEARGASWSAEMVRIMKAQGRAAGLRRLIAPVRPSHKSRYPLTSIDDYVRWRTPEGLPFDPWMRVHARLGARTIAVCHESMGMFGKVADWERWSGLRFPVSGPYAVAECLTPVQIDLEQDRGLYIEPNVWMVHEFGEGA